MWIPTKPIVIAQTHVILGVIDALRPVWNVASEANDVDTLAAVGFTISRLVDACEALINRLPEQDALTLDAELERRKAED